MKVFGDVGLEPGNGVTVTKLLHRPTFPMHPSEGDAFIKHGDGLYFMRDGDWHRVATLRESQDLSRVKQFLVGDVNEDLWGCGRFKDVRIGPIPEGAQGTPVWEEKFTPTDGGSTVVVDATLTVYPISIEGMVSVALYRSFGTDDICLCLKQETARGAMEPMSFSLYGVDRHDSSGPFIYSLRIGSHRNGAWRTMRVTDTNGRGFSNNAFSIIELL